MKVVNIVNPALENQRFTGGLVESGCASLNVSCETTSNQRARGDVTVVHGPNYARDQAKGKVIWLDRCWYGSTREWISLGWKVDDRYRKFLEGDGSRLGAHIEAGALELAPMREAGGFTIAIDDFWQTLEAAGITADIFREHPAHRNAAQGLRAHEHIDFKIALDGCSKAITARGTCAAQALLLGLEVECLDPYNEGLFGWEGDRQRWAEALAWRQFTNEELANGFALELLLATI